MCVPCVILDAAGGLRLTTQPCAPQDFSNLARHKLTHSNIRPFRCEHPGCN